MGRALNFNVALGTTTIHLFCPYCERKWSHITSEPPVATKKPA
jgi:hypothetical protein